MHEEITCEGTVQEILFYNEENGYAVATLDCEDSYLTIRGIVPFIREGDGLKVVGKMDAHPVYGEQLNIRSAVRVAPKDADALFRYLASGIITGIGEATAAVIMEAFGTEALEVLKHTPERYLEISGIGPKKLEAIQAAYAEQSDMQAFIMYFQELGLSINFAMRIYKQYGLEATARVQENPYILAEEVAGIGFKQADQIALRMGVQPMAPYRIHSGILYVLRQESGSGSTYMTEAPLTARVAAELSVDADEVTFQIRDMAVVGKLNLEQSPTGETRIYLPALYHAEQQVAVRFFTIASHAVPIQDFDFKGFIEDFEQRRGILLGARQKEALEGILSSGVFVITGGPGTGKTTLINAVIDAYELCSKKVMLAAPTGRAAKRMTEATQREAKTIHRLLEFQGENQFGKHSESPLETDVLIIDEISMVDIILMYRLLDAVREGTHLLLVGDADQLPSVGPGTVLKDLLQSGFAPYIKLDEIYRQSEHSLIAVNAHRINHGELPTLNRQDKDFFFMERRKPEQVLNEIKGLVTQRLPDYYGFDPREDIQILSPMKNSPLGIFHLNEVLQSVLNPPEPWKREKAFGKKCLREGDKVMQIKNDYTLEWTLESGETGEGVFNGDIGRIEAIDLEMRTLTVLFDGERHVEYDFPSADALELAYAITVHKSQGSEFKAVVMPMIYGPPMLMNRNILYTAITRAKELVVLVGQKQAMADMIARNQENNRASGLTERLRFYGSLNGQTSRSGTENSH